MLRIRKEQMETLERAAVERFEKSLEAELAQALPKVVEMMGEDRFRAKVRSGLARARERGLESQNGLRLFTHLTFLLGGAFDRDPQTAWAAEILDDRESDEEIRVERLHQRSVKHLEEVAGEGGKLIEAVLARLQSEALEGYSQSGLGDFEAYMLRRFWLLYPEKCKCIGENALRKIIRDGMASARARGLTTERGVTLYLALVFLLGVGFDEDPQYAFAQEVLRDPALTEPRKKAEALYAGALEYLKRWRGPAPV
jgi:hypothetical protein